MTRTNQPIPLEEAVNLLRKGSVDKWNRLRSDAPYWHPTLSGVSWPTDLSGASLRGINLWNADLTSADLTGADLAGAILHSASLDSCWLNRADLSEIKARHLTMRGARAMAASFRAASMDGAILDESCLRCADFSDADLSGASMRGVDLSLAKLCRAHIWTRYGAMVVELSKGFSKNNLHEYELHPSFNGAILTDTDITEAEFDRVDLSDTDLSKVCGLDTVFHKGPNAVGLRTIKASIVGGIDLDIFTKFLRKSGLSEWELQVVQLYRPDIRPAETAKIVTSLHNVRASDPFQIAPLFISYSSLDIPFVRVLEQHLAEHGIRYWLDAKDLKAGRLERQLEDAIAINDVVLIVLSQNAVASDWVEFEVRKAREKEKRQHRDVLCPIALDRTWQEAPWPARLRMQLGEYSVLDFSNWEDPTAFDRMFKRLVEGLSLFYKKVGG